MSMLWPRLPEAVALEEYEKVRAGAQCVSATRHPEQVYAPVGERIADRGVADLAHAVTELAVQWGYPAAAPDAARIGFDRSCAGLIRKLVDITWAEAGSRPVWSFIALVPLPHITMWRFGTGNSERWVASDLTRHTWARLWWQAVVFDADPDLLSRLSESDLNQLLERRRAIGGDPRLVRSLGMALVQTDVGSLSRRSVIRDVTKRLRRQLAFIDVKAVNDDQLVDLCRALVQESVVSLRHQPEQ